MMKKSVLTASETEADVSVCTDLTVTETQQEHIKKNNFKI